MSVAVGKKGSQKNGHEVSGGRPADRLTLSQVIDFLPDPTFAIDIHRRVIAWNKALEELTGIHASSQLGRSDYSRAFYGHSRPMLVDLVLGDSEIEGSYLHIERQGDTIVAEGDVETARGTVRLWGKASPIHDDEGAIIGAISSVRDITARSDAERSLQESQQMLRQMVDFLPDPTFAIDLQGRVTVWNRAMEELTKIPSREMIGRGDYEYALPFYGTRRPILIDLALMYDSETEKHYSFVQRKGHALLTETSAVMQGKLVYLWGKASPIFDAAGAVVGAIESIRDITDKKLIEEELREKDAKIRDIFENVSDFLYVHDLEGRFIDSNLTFKDFYGYTGDDLVNLNINDIVHEGDRHLYKGFLARMLARGTDEGIMRIRAKGGEIRFIEYSDSLIYDLNGKPKHIRGSARDVTERVLAEQALRESEQRYRLLAENIRDVIWVIDLDLRYTYVSPSIERLRGFTAEEAMAQSLEAALLPESYAYVVRELSVEMEKEKKGQRNDPFWSRILELRMRCKNGPPIWAEVTASFLRDMDGNPTHLLGVTRDITERKMAEDRLRRSEERFRSLFESSADASLLIEGTRFVDCNQAALDMLKVNEKDQVLNMHPGELSPAHQPDGRRSDEKSEEMISLAMEKGSHRFEWMHLRADGSVFPAEVVLTAIHRGNKKVIYTTWRDITARKEAEEALRKSEQTFRLLAENIGDIIWVADLGMKFTYLSPSVGRISGYTPREFMDLPLEHLLKPESYSLAMRLLGEEVGNELAGRRHSPSWSKTIVLEMYHKDGNTVWTEVMVTFLRNKDGEAVSILGVTRDITEQKKAEDSLRRSEARFRSLFEDSPDPNMLVEEGRIVDCNQAAVALLRAGSKEEILGKHPWDFSPKLQPDGLPSDEKGAGIIRNATEKGSYRFEWMSSTTDGRPLPLEVTLTTIPKAGSRIIYATCRDVTAQRKAEEERRVYEARLIRSQKLEAIGTLAGGIAHDFNNILSAIIGYTELALDDIEKDSPTERFLAEVLRGGDRAKDLVSQILTFSRQIQAEKKVVKMEIILKEALKLLRSSIPSTISIVQDIAPHAPAVFADPTQVHQVIMNLCTNAYQAMVDKGGIMMVSLESRDIDESFAREHPPLSPGAHTVLTIRDTGNGMDQETMSRIFEPFYTTKEKGRGTGLGLSTVHGIVTALSGTVLVASRLGHGSTFSVFLPAHSGDVQELSVAQEDVPTGNGERILMVDDESAILELSKGILETMGYSVTSTSSSRVALEIFSKDPAAFDLVITDQTMPLITGMDLASRMLSIRKDLPVILMSGFSEAVTRESAVQKGIRVYLDKPFTRRAIASAIHEALGFHEE